MQIFSVFAQIHQISSNTCIQDHNLLWVIQYKQNKSHVYPETLSHYLLIFIQNDTGTILKALQEVGILTRSLLRPSWYAQSHQLCLKWDFTVLWRASTIIRSLHALSFPYSHQTSMIYSYKDYLLSALPVTSCKTNMKILVNIFAKELEGKCMLSDVYIYMGINPCVLIWRKLTNLNCQDFCHAW